MTNKFKIGDKVIPISKTAKGWESEEFWQSDKAKEQGYLYVVDVNIKDGDDVIDYSCAYDNCADAGNFYNESDLIPYEEEFVLPERWCFRGGKHIPFDITSDYNKWFKEKFNRTYAFTSNNYYYSDGDYGSVNYKKPDFEEITFEQFKQHVLKTKDNMKISIDELKTTNKYVVYLDSKQEWEKLNELLGFDVTTAYYGKHCYSAYRKSCSSSSNKTNSGAFTNAQILTLNDILNMNKTNKYFVGQKLKIIDTGGTIEGDVKAGDIITIQQLEGKENDKINNLNAICNNGIKFRLQSAYYTPRKDHEHDYFEIVDESKIIGYKTPYALHGGDIPVGTIFKPTSSKPTPTPYYVATKADGSLFHPMCELPKEVVEQWEVVFEEEYKVGDWVITENYSPNYDGLALHIKRFEESYVYFNNSNDPSHNFCTYNIIRKATPEEIEKATGKTISVGGQFDVKVKPNSIFHGSDDITSFVEDMMNTFHFEQSLGEYSATIKEVIFSKTGCQNKKTKLSDWKHVWDEYNKLKN